MANLLDIIIPVYNDEDGLFMTLCSIYCQGNVPVGRIIIVDDCSDEKFNYEKVVRQFAGYLNCQLIRVPSNCGPGVARNEGIKYATSDYITFIDCGDVFAGITVLQKAIEDIKDNPLVYVFSYAHFSQVGENTLNDEWVGPEHNRLMGKIYKRCFLELYDIKFNEQVSRANEDIGFNVLCRLICGNLQKSLGITYLLEKDDVLIRWTYNPKSLTRFNNHAFYYKETESMSKNMIWAYEKASALGVDKELIQEDAYTVLSFLYFTYVGALNAGLSYTEDVFKGALYFYKEYFVKEAPNQHLFLAIYNDTLRNLESRDFYFEKFPPFNVIDFLNILDKKMKGEITNE